MPVEPGPQIYLITPADFEPAAFAGRLEPVIDRVAVACLRLAMSGHDEDRLLHAAGTLREVAGARDMAVTVADHVGLARQAGLDGVHLSDGARGVRRAREALGGGAIVGAHCAVSRHLGMSAGEAGADYVSFGPVAGTGLYQGEVADTDLFAWWAEMIEVPVVAEGALSAERVAALAPYVDFLACGEEVWRADDPAESLRGLVAAAEAASV